MEEYDRRVNDMKERLKVIRGTMKVLISNLLSFIGYGYVMMGFTKIGFQIA